MNLREVVDEVISVTSRPDKVKEIESGINAIIAKLTGMADYYDDLIETTLTVSATAYSQEVSLSSLPSFKKFKYVKPSAAAYLMQPIDPIHLITPGGIVQPNRYYVAGTQLVFTVAVLSPTLDVGYYRYPAILTGTDTHFLLEKSPWAVIDLTAARIFRSIGDESAAAAYDKSGSELAAISRRDFADGYVAGGR